VTAIAAMTSACGFDLTIGISMDPRYGSFEQNGKRVDQFKIERWFTSIDAARRSSIVFEVEDGGGAHQFDLAASLHCGGDNQDPSSLSIGFQATYGNCILTPPEAEQRLKLCWSGSRCDNVFSISR
jgi:hypothetical protein